MNNDLSDPLSARLSALTLLQQILDKKQSFDLLLEHDKSFKSLTKQDRGFTHMLVATTLRNLGQCDDIIAKLQTKSSAQKQPMLQHILRIGLIQILYMNVPDHAAVNTTVDLCDVKNMSRAKNFVNAMLRRFLREKDILLSKQDPLRLNIPEWLLKPLIKDWGLSHAAKISTSLLEEAPIDISIKNPGMLEHWITELDAQHILFDTVRLKNNTAVPTLSGYDDGHWWVQDAAASLPVQIMGDITDKHIYDICAAPGGKTAQLAAKGANVIALDRSAKRLVRLHENMQRLSLHDKVETITTDAASWSPQEPADIVLLDAPCTATGVIRRHPDILHLKSQQDIDALIRTQKQILDHAASFVKSGGFIFYCTCSVLKSEGEDQVDTFLNNHPDFKRLPIQENEIAGYKSFLNDQGDVRLFPYLLEDLGGIDGFFISRLQKK